MLIKGPLLASPFMLATAISPAWGQDYFGSGNCAIVAAARPTTAEAKQWIYENNFQEVAQVFLSSNNWYAITIKVVSKSSSRGIIDKAIRVGIIPSDSYCSSGSNFIKKIEWNAPASSPPQAPVTALWGEFDARPLSLSEKRFLQASLALEGYYYGLIDGVWGRGSQLALEAYTLEKFNNEPLNSHAASLSIDLYLAIDEDGWDHVPIDGLAMGVMMPFKKMRLTEKNGLRQQWEHTDKSLVLIADDLDNQRLASLHGSLEAKALRPNETYKLRNSTRYVTSVEIAGEISLYARSDLIEGTWSTLLISSGFDAQDEINLVVSSITRDRITNFIPPDTGVLMGHVMKLLEEFDDSEPSSGGQVGVSQSPAIPSPEPEQSRGGTGTGFLINDAGALLTNAHVVEGCTSITVNGHAADLITKSSIFDLAAISVKDADLGKPLAFSSESAGLNADITIAGYPLHGLLGGLNVGRGSISALKGLRGDETNLQISAPVQPGNSGGPAVDRFGHVVGVVVSKLDAVEVADLTGDIAQNVNFAVRGDLAKVFLSSNGVDYIERSGTVEMNGEELAQKLQSSTHLIECNR